MKGIVIHYQGKIRRALEGRVSDGRLDVKTITPVPLRQETVGVGCATRRPVYFVFSFGEQRFAASQNVMLTKGRRYPDVEHWFVMAEPKQLLELNQLQQVSAAQPKA